MEHNGKFGVIGMEIKITEEGLKHLSTDKDAMRIWEEGRKESEEEEEIRKKYRQQGIMKE